MLESEDAASYKLKEMIFPQLEDDIHGADVELLFFFDEDCHTLQKGNGFGSKLSNLAQKKDFVLMLCDQCTDQRGLAEQKSDRYQPKNTFSNVQVGCFPDLYKVADERNVGQVIRSN